MRPAASEESSAATPDPCPPFERQARRDLGWSIALIAVVVVLALVGLATDGNWPKILRVGLSFLAYAGTLEAWRRAAAARPTLPFLWFASAGAAAGLVSGLVRPELHLSILLAGTVAATLLLGGVHWLGLTYWRRVRAAIVRPPAG